MEYFVLVRATRSGRRGRVQTVRREIGSGYS